MVISILVLTCTVLVCTICIMCVDYRIVFIIRVLHGEISFPGICWLLDLDGDIPISLYTYLTQYLSNNKSLDP